MTNVLTTALLSALSFTYQPDVRTAYLSRGRISEDRPIQSNLLRLDVSLDEWGGVGLWHWHYNSLTDRMREKRDCQLTESDWGVFYNYGWEIAEDWTLKSEVMIRWFTFLFYHEPYKGESDHSMLEYYLEQSLENPYLVPMLRVRRCVHENDYCYFRTGVRRRFPLEQFEVLEGLTITPAFYVDFGDDNQRRLRYGAKRPDGSEWSSGIMSVLGEITLSYPINKHFNAYTSLQQFAIVDDDARENTHHPYHRDYTIFTVGVKCRF
jgi:hypothetical protein